MIKIHSKKGFTLIELLIVVVILILLTSAGVPSLFRFMKSYSFERDVAKIEAIANEVRVMAGIGELVGSGTPDCDSDSDGVDDFIPAYYVFMIGGGSANLFRKGVEFENCSTGNTEQTIWLDSYTARGATNIVADDIVTTNPIKIKYSPKTFETTILCHNCNTSTSYEELNVELISPDGKSTREWYIDDISGIFQNQL